MKLSDYIKDHILAYIIYAVALACILVFMRAFKANVQSMYVVAAIFIMAVISAQMWDFSRKKTFYERMITALSELDKKYLLSEMLPPAAFYEGKLLTETLRECDKSMAEAVAAERKKAADFREYIEMWVHEAKLPVASLALMCHNGSESPEKMLPQLKRLDDYIENVLYYARSETAEKDYIIKEVSLKKAFSSVAVKNFDSIQEVGGQISADGLNVCVHTDGKWLEFILGQLMANSIKYRREDVPLEISVSAEEGEDAVTLRFKDNGKGIAAADLPYVFEKSFTGKNGRDGANSTGMGLYIVKSLCTRLGHAISINSEENSYTEVVLKFGKNDYYLAE